MCPKLDLSAICCILHLKEGRFGTYKEGCILMEFRKTKDDKKLMHK
jgi:hypothetical protein